MSLTCFRNLHCAKQLLKSPIPLVTVPNRGTKYNKKPCKPCQAPVAKAKIESMVESMSSRGFLRPYKEYDIPRDADEKLDIAMGNLDISRKTKKQSKEEYVTEKYNMLMRCAKEFNYYVPNSQLVEMEYNQDVRRFYKTAVSTKTPFEMLQYKKLPPNLHVTYNYTRFNEDTAAKFKGRTAFPRNATIVTGLKYKDKYKGYNPDDSIYGVVNKSVINAHVD